MNRDPWRDPALDLLGRRDIYRLPSRYLVLWPLAGVVLLSACDGEKPEWPENLGISSSLSRAVSIDAFAETGGIEYPVNFVCGLSPPGLQDPVLAGLYKTLVNIYNPHRGPITVRMRVSPSIPPGKLRGGKLSGFVTRNVDAFRALAVDCQSIISEFLREASTSLTSGVLVIQSSVRVEVVATYTAGLVDSVKSIHVERIPAL